MSTIRELLAAVCPLAVGFFLMSSGLLAQSRVQRITLDDAKTDAAAAAVASKAAEIAKLSVDAARYRRQAVQADYFPKIGSNFLNLHFNKFMGQTVQLRRLSADLPLLAKDETAVTVTLTQPVTPIFKIRQAVDISRADETIAKAKAGQSIAQIQTNVERTYFALLMAQREQTLTEVKMQMAERALLAESRRDLVTARSKVIELTYSLNALMGLPLETELELVAPAPALQTISAQQATQQALSNSPEIVEAEQTVVKARAATRLSKLDYVPEVAVVGGYVNQTAVPLLPTDFTYIGVIASLNLFDFGKREKTAKERQTQLEMARAAVDLTKAKVAANVQKAFLDLERARKIRDLTLPTAAGRQATLVSYQNLALTDKADRVKAEEEMFQAELDYRMAYAQLMQIIEGR